MSPVDRADVLEKTKGSDLKDVITPRVVHDLEENLNCAIALIHVEEDGWLARFEAIVGHIFPLENRGRRLMVLMLVGRVERELERIGKAEEKESLRTKLGEMASSSGGTRDQKDAAFVDKVFERGINVPLMVSMFLALIRILGCFD